MRNGGDDNLDHGGQMSQPLRIRSGDDEGVVRQIQETQLDQTTKDVPADVA